MERDIDEQAADLRPDQNRLLGESVLDDSQLGFVLGDQFPEPVRNLSDGSTQVLRIEDVSPAVPGEEFEMAVDDDDSIPSDEEGSIHHDEAALHDPSIEDEPTSISGGAGVVAPIVSAGPAVAPMFDSVAAPFNPESQRPRPEAAPAERKPVSASKSSKSRLILILLASYASAITIAFLLLLMRGSRQHQLESLPDVQPESSGQITFVPVDAELPAGHVLELGSKQRFGNIVVEPLRVTNEPVEFSHFSGNLKKSREPSAPVWKLWIRFTNASSNQTIVPLDRHLLLRWVIKRDTMKEYTNQFLRNTGTSSLDDVVMLYRLPPASEWDLIDQNLGVPLAPGESLETYIASSDEGLDSLQDQVLWRLQFRKGFSDKGNGVTTLIDVAFRRDEVQVPAG